ncbi:polymerase III polypeptide H [Moniliophthora roreri]|nr:polymerase III polypeptide H [Moniliophthora roreri]
MFAVDEMSWHWARAIRTGWPNQASADKETRASRTAATPVHHRSFFTSHWTEKRSSHRKLIEYT